MYVLCAFHLGVRSIKSQAARHPQAAQVMYLYFTAGFSMVPDKTSEWDFPWNSGAVEPDRKTTGRPEIT